MRTITNLYNEGDTVFIRFENEAIGKRFLQDAEREGFLINGKSQLQRAVQTRFICLMRSLVFIRFQASLCICSITAELR